MSKESPRQESLKTRAGIRILSGHFLITILGVANSAPAISQVPRKFDLVINLKTAGILASLYHRRWLIRADKVFQ